MPTLRVRAFAGLRPERAADLLAPGEALVAQNVKLAGGDLEPLKGTTTVTAIAAGTLAIYRYGETNTNETQWWFTATADRDWVRGPVVSDTEERTYWTDGTFPKKTKANLAIGTPPYPTNFLRMGLPAPAAAPSYTVTGSPTDPNSVATSVAYVITYVSSWGEESAPSPVSATGAFRAGQTVSLTALPTAPVGAYDVVGKRLYRATAGNISAAFRLVNTEGDIPVATTTYADTKNSEALGEALATRNFDQPPDTMRGLCVMANEVLAGFDGNTVCFSEPGLPYAWPVRYRLAVDSPVVGICGMDDALFVGAARGLYVITGTDPASMTMQRLPVEQGLASKRSLVAMNGGVVFAAPNGLFFYGPGGLRDLTEGLLSREQWQAYNPSSMLGAVHDGRYIAFYDNGTTQAGLIFTLGSEPNFTTTTLYATAAFRERGRDILYLAIGTNIVRWDAGSNLTYTWRSGVFRLGSETNMGTARVMAATYPVTLRVYTDDGTLRHTQSVTSRYPFRLPSGFTAQRWFFELEGTATVRSVEIATTPGELTVG